MKSENALPPLVPVATLGFLRALLRRVRHREPPAPPLIVQELMARHETLVAQIRAVEENAFTRPQAVVAAERAVLQEAASSVFQELEQQRAAIGSAATPLPPASGGHRPAAWRRGAIPGFIVGVAVVASLVGMALVVAGPKPASRTGATGQTAPTHPAVASDIQTSAIEGHAAPVSGNDIGPEEAAARAALAKNPEDVNARLELARLRLDKQDYMAVWEETKRVLAGAPEDPRALSYQSQVRLAMGQPDLALEMLKRALDKDPLLLQAYIYKSQVHLRMGQAAEAREAIAEAKRRYPAQAAWLDSGFRQMESDTRGMSPLTPAAAADPHSGLGGAHPPGADSSPHGEGVGVSPHGRIAPGPDVADLAGVVGPSVSGTLELDASLQGQIPAGALVFLSVREAGFGAGPPVAAKRLPASFPQSFTLGPEDSMQGERLPDTLLLEARIDTDGDASTRGDADPRARLDDVKVGASGVRLVLRRP